MELNLPLIVVGLVFSGVGFVYFSFGRRQANLHLIVNGLVLMVYPYFVTSVLWSVIVGVAIGVLPFLMRWW